MSRSYAFHVPGEPQGKGRPRVGKVGQHVRMFTPAKTVAYEGLVAMAAQQAMQGAAPITGPVRLRIVAAFSVPASYSKAKRAQAMAGTLRPTKKPDIDNVLKAVADGMNGVVWVDDVQAVDVHLSKLYSDTPGVSVAVQELS